MKHEKELIALIKNIDDEILEALTKIMEAMLEDQKAQEAEKYAAAFPLPPAEIAEIIENNGGGSILSIEYALDAIRYYAPHLMRCDAETRMLWTVSYLLEAGKIIGIKQERARRRAGKHGKV